VKYRAFFILKGGFVSCLTVYWTVSEKYIISLGNSRNKLGYYRDAPLEME
jgi:hypothetical protein